VAFSSVSKMLLRNFHRLVIDGRFSLVLGLCCIRTLFQVDSGINHSALVTRGQSSIEEVMIGNLEALVLVLCFLVSF